MSKQSLQAAKDFLAANPEATDAEIIQAVMSSTGSSEAVAKSDVATIRKEESAEAEAEAESAEGFYLNHPILGFRCKDLQQAVTVMKNKNNGGLVWIDEEAAMLELAELEKAED